MKYQCNINGFTFIFQDHGWSFASLNCSSFYKDLLHLIEQGNIKLAKSITLTITSRYKDINLSSTNSTTSYSHITTLVKPLNVSKPVCSSNITKRNVCNTNSVSQRIKPLNVSKPVCSSKTTKRNVCNGSNVSQFTKLLNVSIPLYSSKVINHIVCSTSSVSKIIKPLNVSNTVYSN